MRILIDDGMQVKVGTGIGKYTQYLYTSLQAAIQPNDTVDLFQFDKGESSKIKGRIKYFKYINSHEFQEKCSHYDIVHFTNYAIPTKRVKGVKYVVTIHDLASFLHPDSLPKKYLLYNRFITNYSLSKSDAVLTVSKSVKEEICNKWPKYAKKISYIYPGLYDEFLNNTNDESKEYQLAILNSLTKGRFFLFVGTIESRKNLEIIINAFLHLKKLGMAKDFKLVLAGRPGFGFEQYKQLIEESQYKKDILTTGYISTNDCRRLYKEAAAYIFPSEYEGFGSTQLECMANHLPIILSDIPTNREVSDGYGLFFELEDQESLESQMLAIIHNNYDFDSHSKLADELLQKYNWKSLNKQYMDYYSKVYKA